MANGTFTEEIAKGNNAQCDKCGISRVPVQKKPTVSLTGILSAIGFMIGLVVLLANVVAGLLVIIVSVVIGLSRREYTVMVCPNCGDEGLRL